MQEILVVAAIALAIFFIPRLMNRNGASADSKRPSPQPGPASATVRALKASRLTGGMRVVMVVSLLWLGGCFAYFRPWESYSFLFFCVGLGPTAALWGGLWAWAGYKKYRR